MQNEIIPQARGLYDPRYEHDSCGVGFVCDIKGKKSHLLVQQGLEVLRRLAHRGAVGADPKTGDGAGILIQIPHEFYQRVCAEHKIKLPPAGAYGTGLVFLPPDKKEREFCKAVFASKIEEEGQLLLGWREVSVDNSDIGKTAKGTQPVIEQPFIQKGKQINNQLEFEQKLYVIRRQIEQTVRSSPIGQKSFFYISNLSSRTISYKGLLMPDQIGKFFPELNDESIKSSIALVHSRYSTNTFPTWDLSQPFRFLAHNGEINTLRGNINWMQARGIAAIVPGGSDSAALDNVFELLVLSGRSLPHALMMLIPAAWEDNKFINKKEKDFYRYHACFMEPWDGPAAIAFTDGTRVGAVLDRNGLRPARFIVTKDDLVVMASEVGVLDIPPENIARSGRLEPGKMFYIDTEEGRIIDDVELKEKVASRRPYEEWLEKNLVDIEHLPRIAVIEESGEPVQNLLKIFGYTREDLKFIIKPMAEKGVEPVGSMGNDTPHAVLSKKPSLLYEYFKQLFAQVTNPAIDPIREELIMSLESWVGTQRNILEETPEHCNKMRVKEPVLTNRDLAKIRAVSKKMLKAKTLSILFKADDEKDFIAALDRIGAEAELAISEGFTFIILSDKGVNREYAALPALLATATVHHHLIRKALRTQIGIILESGEVREVHHFALLFGYGADLINPYLAYEAVEYLVKHNELVLDANTAILKYRRAVQKGLLKILSKMGISTLNSYRGAQIFEALGLSEQVIERCFTGTVSRIGGANLSVIAQETILRHQKAYENDSPLLESGGIYQWKRDGEFHLWNPDSIAALQDAVRKEDYDKYKEFTRLINDQSKNPTTLRSLFKFKPSTLIPIATVEPVESIVKRFATGAMSFGSISQGAHETIAQAMNQLGGRSNSGEGGEAPERFKTNKRSAVKQVASGRFGVTTNYLINADELQIKIAQGAKPGEGGQLPGYKVSPMIARIRCTTPGVTLISPPPHHDIYSIEDLAQLIFDLKNVNPQARISVKLVSEIGVGTIAAGVAKGHADMILISGGDGGTGASPLSSIRHAGLPWELGLSETHQTLVLNDLRSRVRLQTDGQMRTGRDVAIAAMLGAEEFGFSTVVLIVLGCVMLRHCHLNNCSVGIATQDEILSKRFGGKVEDVIHYFQFVAQELREIMAELGIQKLDDLIGRSDLLELNKEILPWKMGGADYSKILYRPSVAKDVKTRWSISQAHGIEKVLDRQLIEKAKAAIETGQRVKIETEIKNHDRTTGAMLSGEVCKKYGEEGLPEDSLWIKFNGVAGQSFGAWLAKGVTLELEGLANDYVGKGLSGGKIIIYPNKKADYRAEENIIIGNTTFYGAIAGEVYIRGVAGERFCIRNSGIRAVVEGVGDHGCEYMTGGKVVVIGKTGRNFAAGMSGGIAYVYDKDGNFPEKCNLSMVVLEEMKEEDRLAVLSMLRAHLNYTGSEVAKKIIDDFSRERSKFVKVMPIEYKRVMEEEELEERDLQLIEKRLKQLEEVSDG